MGTLGTTIIPAARHPFMADRDGRKVIVEPIEAVEHHPTDLTAITVTEGEMLVMEALLLSPTACRLLAGALEAAADAQEHREQRRRDMR